MVEQVDAEVRALAGQVLATLMTRTEQDQHDVGVMVERRRVGAAWSEPLLSDSADLLVVSLGYPGSSRDVWVDVHRGGQLSHSLAEAALAIADAFQDEVIELLNEARPVCAGHTHPMAVKIEGATTLWHCPTNPETQLSLWP